MVKNEHSSENLWHELRARKWQIAGGLLTLLIAGVGWHLRECILVMQDETEQFKQAVANLRPADQQYQQNAMAMVERSARFFEELLPREPISGSDLTRARLEIIRSLQQLLTPA